MTRAFLALVLRLYPKSWRARYGAEFQELLATEPITLVVLVDVARAAAIERLFNPSGLGARSMSNNRKWLRIALIALPALVLLANAQFAFVSYRHAEIAHQHVLTASQAGNSSDYRFWRAMELEEGGEYKDSLHFGVGLLIGLMFVVSVARSRRRHAFFRRTTGTE